MMKELDLFYLQQEEPAKSCFLTLRDHILQYNQHITETWKFRMPFFCCMGQSFCYFRIERKSGKPYIGFTEGKWLDHPALVSEKRSRIKILLVDPATDLPFKELNAILKAAVQLCDSSL
jgi:hypothetical protein